jgi:hypothetical protein
MRAARRAAQPERVLARRRAAAGARYGRAALAGVLAGRDAGRQAGGGALEGREAGGAWELVRVRVLVVVVVVRGRRQMGRRGMS